MTRALVAIGCSRYENISPQLRSPEEDAKRIHGTLVGASRYHYRSDISSLLLSPTSSEVRTAVQALYDASPAEVCVYFAGHAESRDGRLFLKFRDTRNNSLPPTSITLGELLDLLVGCPTVSQLNVVIDACNAGGLSSDLSRILSDQAQRMTGTTSISILAGSGPTSAAIETARGGRLTNGILEVLGGTLIAQRWSPFLELAHIADAIRRLPEIASQKPSNWSMNFRGANPVAPNPSFDPATAATASPGSYFAENVPLGSEQERTIREFYHALRTQGFQPSAVRQVQTSLKTLTDAQQVSVYLGLADSIEFYEQERVKVAPPRETMLLQALLPLSVSASVTAVIQVQANQLASKLQQRLQQLKIGLADDRRFLLNRPAGFSELYYLPLRIALLLGWIGYAVLHGETRKIEDWRDLARSILQEYGNSLIAVDDRQSSGIFLFLLAAKRMGWTEEVEEVLGRLFNDILRSYGRICQAGADTKQRLRYLMGRYQPQVELKDATQSPSELLAVVMIFGAIAALDYVWDPLLIELDHASINLFLVEDPREFADEKIAGGENATLAVGQEFHKLNDLRRLVADLVAESPRATVNDAVLDAISLAMPDRVNWRHLLRDIHAGRIEVNRPPLRISEEDPTTGMLTTLYEQ
jgi:hypothetical protein